MSHYSSSVNSNPAQGNISDQVRTKVFSPNRFPNRHAHTSGFFFFCTLCPGRQTAAETMIMTQPHLCWHHINKQFTAFNQIKACGGMNLGRIPSYVDSLSFPCGLYVSLRLLIFRHASAACQNLTATAPWRRSHKIHRDTRIISQHTSPPPPRVPEDTSRRECNC